MFTPAAADRAWCQDITYVPTAEGRLDLASVLDLGSAGLLGYSVDDHIRTELVLDALSMAVVARHGVMAGVTTRTRTRPSIVGQFSADADSRRRFEAAEQGPDAEIGAQVLAHVGRQGRPAQEGLGR